MIEAAFQGVGLAWTSEFAVAPDVAAGRLNCVLKDWTPPYPGLCLDYPGHRHVPAGLRIALDGVTAYLGQQRLFGIDGAGPRRVDCPTRQRS